VKIEIKQQPPKQQAMQSLRMRQVGNIAVSAVDVNLPNMQESFTMSDGMGGFGSGGGSLLGGTSGTLGIGMSEISVFGLKTRAERVLFVVDASRSMITDKKGGLGGYKFIKDEITDMVGNLSAGTLFNVLLADGFITKFMKPQLVPAGQKVHQELIQWIAPINSNARNAGLAESENFNETKGDQKLKTLTEEVVHQDIIKWPNHPSNEVAFLTQLALEQDVDAIFFVSGYHRGFDQVRRDLNEKEEAAWLKRSTSLEFLEQKAAHNKEMPEMANRVRNALAKINNERKEKGLPPRILDNTYGYFEGPRQLGLEWKNKRPELEPYILNESRVTEKYFEAVIDVLYTNKRATPPSVNVLLFLAGDQKMNKKWEDQVDDYTDFFGGEYRIIRGLDQIKDARSSSNTKN